MIYLVRHAATDWSGVRFCGTTDVALSDEGRRQAAALARVLAERTRGAASIRTSPARRARETAQAIAGPAAPLIDDRLREANFGSCEGLRYEDLERSEPAVARALLVPGARIDWPGGESWSALAARTREAWAEAGRLPGPVVLVTHGGPARALLELIGCPGDPPAPAEVLALDDASGWRCAWRWRPEAAVAP